MVAYLKGAVIDYVAWNYMYILETGGKGVEVRRPFGASHNRKDSRCRSNSPVDKRENIGHESNAEVM